MSHKKKAHQKKSRVKVEVVNPMMKPKEAVKKGKK